MTPTPPTVDDEIGSNGLCGNNADNQAAMKLYGQTHLNETPELISNSLQSLRNEMKQLPHDKKMGWLKAEKKCADLVNDEKHLLMFLRCEVFNVHLAAVRLAKYWDMRIQIFGEKYAFLPLTLNEGGALGSIPNIEKGLRLGLIRLTETHDTGGRAIVYVEIRRLVGGYDKNDEEQQMNVARSVWYTLHSALHDSDNFQKMGAVFIANYLGAGVSVVDRKMMRMIMSSLSGCIPIRVGAFHVCYPPWFFGKIVFPIMKIIMSDRMKKRIFTHSHSNQEKMLKDLEKYGLKREALPTELGGGINLDLDHWLHKRKMAGK